MRNYLYYATEENLFETEKKVTENPHDDIKGYLMDSFLSEEYAEQVATEIVSELNADGFGYRELTDGQGYEIVIGVARFGYCSKISNLIAHNRQVAIAYCN